MRYSAAILKLFFNPENVGVFEPTEKNIGCAVVGNYENGAVVHFYIKVVEQTIIAAKFKAYGTAPSARVDTSPAARAC